MKSHDKNDMVKALTPRGVNLSDKSFLLVAFFLFFLIAIPFLSAVWWNPFTWFNEDTGETIEYETPYNEIIEEPIPEEPVYDKYDNSENIYDIKGYRFENYRIIQTGEEYQYDVVMEKDIKNGKLKIKVQKDYNAKSTLPKVLILQDEKGNILSSALLEIKGNKYEYNFDYDKPKKKAKIGKNSITIIKISDAEYLNSSRDLVENIYDYVKAEDNITYSATNGNYIRVNFEQQLKNGNDISLYASGSGSIEIYKEGTNDLVGTISGISSYKKYSILLSNVGERTDTFDLKLIGNVDIDYIVDPTGYFVFQINITSDGQTFGFVTDNAADLFVGWGDGSNDTYSGTGTRTHTYSTAGIYNVSLNGQATRIAFYGTGATPTLLIDVLTKMSDGLTGITSAYQMFRGCTQITTFTEPAFFDDVSLNVTTLQEMFIGATNFNGNISNWDTSKVTNMYGTFWGASIFNQSLNSWNTSKVTNMGSMFRSATAFNQDISNWNTSKVTNMGGMFGFASSFNQPIGNWNTSKVTSFYETFYGASSFNQSLSNWDTSQVTTTVRMFRGATSFNQPLDSWNTSKMTIINSMFWGATSFNRPLDRWDTSNLENVGDTFNGASSFNQDISNWNVSSITTAIGMFSGVTLPTVVYDGILIKWSNQNLKTGVTISFGGSKYCDNASRNILIDDWTWSITDGGYAGDEICVTFCTPNLVNTSKTSWVDTTSCIDGFVNQSRNWTQYDFNDCGEVANETFFEYRTTSCGGTVLTAPTISLLNCRIPNTNPLCWFYSFGMSLISKNIILINGGILNIL